MADEDDNFDLRKFVAEECEAQAAESASGFTNSAVGVERMNAFYERALNESERMSNEVRKCHIQRRELHKELGADLFEEWTHDHAKHVLSNQRYELWSKEEEKSKIAMQKLQETVIHDDNSSEDAEK